MYSVLCTLYIVQQGKVKISPNHGMNKRKEDYNIICFYFIYKIYNISYVYLETNLCDLPKFILFTYICDFIFIELMQEISL